MGSSKKQTVGYRYSLGEHLIFTHGPVDKFSRLTFDGSRVAWSGNLTAEGSGSVFAPTLFGGEDIGREGGVKGPFDFCPGEPTQGRNAYLQSKLGTEIPAFRGVSALVFKQMYLGTSAYLKKVSARFTRIHKTTNGAEQWYDEKAEIPVGGAISPTSLWEWQNVGATVTPPADPEAFPVPATGWNPALPAPFGHDATGGGWDVPPIASPWPAVTGLWIRRQLVLFGPTDELQIYIKAENAAWLYFDGAFIGATNPTNVQGGDGEFTFDIPNDLATKGTHTVAIYALDENAAIPSNSDTYIYAETVGTETSGDMNPAHIIRECLTDNLWGMGYNASDVDDVAFAAAADQLYDEGMGISILWDQQMPIEQFIQEIIKHIDAALYVDRRTGKFVLKLIRGDYDIDTIPAFDESNIDKVEGFQRPTIGELTNMVTVTYWDSVTGQKATLTRDDPALILTQEAVIATTLQYPGFTNATMAERVALRDLKTLSNPLASCTIYADSDAEDLNIGSVIKWSWADYGIVNMPMRITAIAFGDGMSNKVKMSVAQDVFTLPEAGIIQTPDTGWEDPNQPPEASEHQLAFELPYVELLQQLGLSTVESTLSSTPEVGYAGIAISRPSGSAINARMMIDAGAGYEEVGLIDFCPTAVLDEDIDQLQTTFAITEGSDLATALDLGAVGSWVQIDDELMIVVALDDDSMEVERGTLDTTPAPHEAGAAIFFWDNFAQNDDEQYVETDSLNIKALTITGQGELDISDAPANPLTIVARAIKPYAPGKLLIDGGAYPTTTIDFDFDVAWAHRNRVTQGDTLVPTTDGDVTPEVGTTYTVRVYLDGVLDSETTGITDAFLNDITIAGNGDARVEVWSVRDTIESFQPLWAEFPYIGAVQITDDMPDWSRGNVFSHTCPKVGGEAPFTWTIESGSLPTGLSLNASTGEISGTPSVSGTYNYTLRCTDNTSAYSEVAISQLIAGDASFASVVLLLGFNGVDGATTTTDDSTSAKTGTFTGNAQIDTAKAKWGTASLLCDGNGDSVTYPNGTDFAFGTGDFTFEAWVWANSYPNTFNGILGKWGSSGQRGWDFGYRPASNRYEFYYTSNGSTNVEVDGNTAVATGAWHHIAVCRNGSNLRMFIDGTQTGSTHNIGAATVFQSTETLKIMRGSTASTEYFDGWIDDVRITKGVARYTSNFTPAPYPNPRGT